MSEYWQQLAIEIDAFNRRRQLYKAESEKRARERADHYASGRGRLAPAVLRRNISRRVRLFPWTATDLDELAQYRGSDPGTMSANILEACVSLWNHHHYDKYLYIRRVDLPEEADAVLGVTEGPRPSMVELGMNEGHLSRTFGKVVMAMIHAGVPVPKIIQSIGDIHAAYKQRRG